VLHDDSQVDTTGELAAEGLVSVGRGPQAMVQVGETGDGEIAVFRQLAEQKEKGDGVGTAGESDEHTAALAAQGVAFDGLSDSLVKGGRCQIPNPKSQDPNPKKSQTLPIGAWDLGFGSWDLLICRRADSNCRPR